MLRSYVPHCGVVLGTPPFVLLCGGGADGHIPSASLHPQLARQRSELIGSFVLLGVFQVIGFAFELAAGLPQGRYQLRIVARDHWTGTRLGAVLLF